MSRPVALFLSCTVSLLGYRARALTGNGALAAVSVGYSVLRGFGWAGALILGTFFASGSVLSRRFEPKGTSQDSSKRRAVQVLANGGVPALLAIAEMRTSSQTRFAGYSGALAAATSDTWATALGATSRSKPRMILTGRRVRPGTSGGVTARGTLASIAGAAVVGTLSGVVRRDASLGMTVTVSGLAGSIVDSLLGETLQARYWSPQRRAVVETATGRAPTVSGIRYLDNDGVNFVCTATGAVLAMVLAGLTGRR